MREKFPITLLALLLSLGVFLTNFTPTLMCAYAKASAERQSIASSGSVVDAIAVWQHGETGARDIWYSIWDDTSGQWWSPSGVQASPLAELIGDDLDPAIAFDREGNAIAVWSHETDNASLGYDIWYSKWSGNNWTPPAEVASLAEMIQTPPSLSTPTVGQSPYGYRMEVTYIIPFGTAQIGSAPHRPLFPIGPCGPFGVPTCQKSFSPQAEHEVTRLTRRWPYGLNGPFLRRCLPS